MNGSVGHHAGTKIGCKKSSVERLSSTLSKMVQNFEKKTHTQTHMNSEIKFKSI